MSWHVRHFPHSPKLQRWQIRSAQTARYLQYIPMLLSVYLAFKYFPYTEIQPFFKSWGYDTVMMGVASLVTVLVKSIALAALFFVTGMVGFVVLPIYLVGATTVNPLVFVLMPIIFEIVGGPSRSPNPRSLPLIAGWTNHDGIVAGVLPWAGVHHHLDHCWSIRVLHGLIPSGDVQHAC